MSKSPEPIVLPEIPSTFRDFLVHCGRVFKNRTALIEHHNEDRRSLTYKQLLEEVNRVSFYFLGKGIKKSDRIGLLCENRLEWIVVALATVNIGAVLVPLDTNLTIEELALLIKRSRIKMIGTSRSFLVAAVKGREQHEESIPILCFDPIQTGANLVPWTEVQQQSSQTAEPGEMPVSAEDPALLIFTSGTTSDPKAVVLSHRNILSSAWWTCKDSRILFPETRLFFAIPLFHMFTFTAAFIAPCLAGGCVILGSSLKPIQFQVELQASKATVLAAVPLIFEGIHRSIQAKLSENSSSMVRWLLKLHSFLVKLGRRRTWTRISRYLYARVHASFGGHLKYLVSGGAPLNSQVGRGLENLGFVVLQGYGLTETGPVIATESPSFSRLGSVGRPLSHFQVRIAHPNRDGIGEIQVMGDGVMKGYEGTSHLNQEVFEEGWFKTGDLGYLDSDGYLYICGRNKDLIVTSGGINIYPEDLEKFYLQSPWIKEICIHEQKDPAGRHEGLYATIVPNLDASHEELTQEQLAKITQEELERISVELPHYKRVRHFILSKEELSKTTLKKIRRHKIREISLGGAMHGKERL